MFQVVILLYFYNVFLLTMQNMIKYIPDNKSLSSFLFIYRLFEDLGVFSLGCICLNYTMWPSKPTHKLAFKVWWQTML